MYKIGNEVKVTLDDPESVGFNVGELVDIINKETRDLIAKYEVTEREGAEVTGVITNTYGHKRRKNVT
jgi:hypothetical protein